jgi:hypothetical protein
MVVVYVPSWPEGMDLLTVTDNFDQNFKGTKWIEILANHFILTSEPLSPLK